MVPKMEYPQLILNVLKVMFHGLSPIFYGIPMFVVLIIWVSPCPQSLWNPMTSARERGLVCHAKGAWKIFGSSHLRKVEELQARCRNKMVYIDGSENGLFPNSPHFHGIFGKDQPQEVGVPYFQRNQVSSSFMI